MSEERERKAVNFNAPNNNGSERLTEAFATNRERIFTGIEGRLEERREFNAWLSERREDEWIITSGLKVTSFSADPDEEYSI